MKVDVGYSFNMGQAVCELGGVETVCKTLSVTEDHLARLIGGRTRMSARVAKNWNENFGQQYPVSVSEGKQHRRVVLRVDHRTWQIALMLGKKMNRKPADALGELARIGSFESFPAMLAWMHAYGAISEAYVPEKWRLFRSAEFGENFSTTIDLESMLEPMGADR